MAAELPAGQHRLHPRRTGVLEIERRVKKGEGQQHPGPGQGRHLLGHPQAAQSGRRVALGQLKAPRPAQFQAIGPARRGNAEARRPIPEKPKTIGRPGTQPRQHQQRIEGGQRQSQAQHPLGFQPACRLGGDRQQLAERQGSLHQGLADGAGVAAQMYGPCSDRRCRRPLQSQRSSQAVTPDATCGGRRSSGRCTRWR